MAARTRKLSRVAPEVSKVPAVQRPDTALTARSWLTPLAAEQRSLNALLLARKAARTLASVTSRQQVRVSAGLSILATPADAIPSHLLRHATEPLQQQILELVLFRLSNGASDSSEAASRRGGSASTETFRVATADDDSEEVDLRRRRIYALNQLLSARHQEAWRRYRHRRQGQLNALEKCAERGAVQVARWGLLRFAEQCRCLRRDERLREIVRAKQEARRAAEARQREADLLARCAADAAKRADDEANLRENEAMLQAMPIDPEGAQQAHRVGDKEIATGSPRRFCPWNSTADGCPLSECPLSHRTLPTELVTWKYRAWALESHNGWLGEKVNALPCR